MENFIKCKVIYDRCMLWKTPGGVRHVCFLFKGNILWVTQGWRYEERPWKDKRFVKVLLLTGQVGYVRVDAIKQVEENEDGCKADNTDTQKSTS